METMIERAAAALKNRRAATGYTLEDEVRAVIGAMREPAGPPLDAATSALYRLYVGDGGFIGTEAAKEQILLTHCALIDAALNPTPTASDTNSPP